MMQQMQQCCCQTKTAIIEQGYQSQLAIERQTNGIQAQMAANHSSEQLQSCQNQNQTVAAINNLGTLLQQGFTQLGFSGERNTQRVLDHMCNAEAQALRDKLAEASQKAQTAEIIAALKTTTTTTGA